MERKTKPRQRRGHAGLRKKTSPLVPHEERVDFAGHHSIQLLTWPFLWLLSWNRLLEGCPLRNLFFQVVEVRDPRATNGDRVPVLQRRVTELVGLLAIWERGGRERSKRKPVRQGKRPAELTKVAGQSKQTIGFPPTNS